MTGRLAPAPYAAGDWASVLRHDSGGTMLGPLQVDRVVRLGDGRSWRLWFTRANGQPLEVTVDGSGRDVHGYVSPAALCVFCRRPILGEPVRDEEQTRWLRRPEWEAWCSVDCLNDTVEARATGGSGPEGA